MRLDRALVARGLAPSRTRAAALIAEGAVTVGGRVATRAAEPVGEEEIALAAEATDWVSRAALKLDYALDHFGLSPEGAIAADIGASTGGFSEVLLARGAARVIAIEVGHGQMHPRIAADPRVELRERVNARHLAPETLPALDWVVSDLSFISQTKALGPALTAVAPGGRLISLVKPQFELGPGAVGRGGIVRDPEACAKAEALVTAWLQRQGWEVQGRTDSPIQGGDGNRESLLSAQKL